MTLQTLNAPILWPGICSEMLGTPSISNDQTLDAAGEYNAYVFQALQDMTVSHVAWRTGGVAGAPTVDTRIETVATDGTPSGTLFGTDTNIVSGALSASTTALHALTASASITRGQFFAVKILYQSGTSVVVQQLNNLQLEGNPYRVTNTSGSAAKSRISGLVVALGSSATSFYNIGGICMAATAVTTSAFNNTNSAARGLRFQVPFKCRCAGIKIYLNAAVGDFNAVLYDDAGTELSSSSTAYDGDFNPAVGNHPYSVSFDSPVTLSPGTWYRAAIEPSSATNSSIAFFTLLSANYRSGTLFGSNAHYTTRASGSWTDSATDQIPLMDIWLDQLDDGVNSGGGLIRHPGMAGGMAA